MLHCPVCDSTEIRVCVDGGCFTDDNGDEWDYKCIDCGAFFDFPCQEVNQ